MSYHLLMLLEQPNMVFAMKNKIKNIYQNLHTKSPAIGKVASFTTAAGIIGTNTLTYGMPLWLLGATSSYRL